MTKTATLKIFAVILILSIFFSFKVLTFAVSDSTNVNLWVSSNCGDGVCDPDAGENESNCPADCGCNNNGVCESERGENNSNCPLDCPSVPTPTPPPSAGGVVLIPDTTPPLIYNLFISKITLNSVTISWDTDEQAICRLFLGDTDEYKKEIYAETVFLRKHTSEIVRLFPNTTYHFKISCQDTSKNESETTDQRFTTLSKPDITPPANVSNLKATPDDKKITLSWRNPLDADFKGVKILRSDKFYPTDPWDGEVVYNNSGVLFIDTGLENGVRYYYSVFAYDKGGNYSSGAIISEVPRKILPPEIQPPIFPLPPPEIIPPVRPAPPEIEKLNINDFDFTQNDRNIPLIEGKVIEAKGGEPLVISIKYEKIPEVLKTILVTLEKDDRFFSFLLRTNKDKTVYEATVLMPEEEGLYSLTITILDYKNQTLKQIKGEIRIKGAETTGPLPFKYPCFRAIILWICVWLILIFVIFIFALIRRKIREEKRTNS